MRGHSRFARLKRAALKIQVVPMRGDAGEGAELLPMTRSAELALLVYPSEYDFGHPKDAARFIVMPGLVQAQILERK